MLLSSLVYRYLTTMSIFEDRGYLKCWCVIRQLNYVRTPLATEQITAFTALLFNVCVCVCFLLYVSSL